jgi:tRNA A-37 threonylcarbamoyl transferase component Bud32/DNA-binding response OmpR family regulator
MEEPRQQKFLIVESDAQYAAWIRHTVGAGWPTDSIVVMDWTSFGRVHAAMSAGDYDIVMLAMKFDEGIEEPTTDSFEWIRKLRTQQRFPEMIVLAEGGSELAAVRSLRLGAADYLPKRLLTPGRLQRSIKLVLRMIEKDAQRRAAAAAKAAPKPAEKVDRAEQSLPAARPLPAHIATHTGASLARAAALATAPAPAPTPAPAAASPPRPTPISTLTGSSLANAAKAALAAHAPVAVPATPAPTPAPAVAPTVAATQRDPAARSLPAVAHSIPTASGSPPSAQTKDSKQVAPASHHIPGYTTLQKIGESEAAAVYLAIADDLGHNVALKVSKRKHSGDASSDTGQRGILFQREFEAIAALDHPSIIDLFDYGIHEGVEYLAMEYFPCGDLKARLQNPLTADEAIQFLREIARSLKIVHEAGIIHRDLKPPNVMLRDDGSVVLIDFGLARSLMGGDSSTRTGVLRGSPYYMSPEQAQGEVLDARTDLYSLGVMLYEMLAGKKPYLGASAIDVLQQHVMAPVPELPVHHLFYQPLLERLMAKSREQRIATCDELLNALDQMTQSANDSVIDPETLVSAGAATT